MPGTVLLVSHDPATSLDRVRDLDPGARRQRPAGIEYGRRLQRLSAPAPARRVGDRVGRPGPGGAARPAGAAARSPELPRRAASASSCPTAIAALGDGDRRARVGARRCRALTAAIPAGFRRRADRLTAARAELAAAEGPLARARAAGRDRPLAEAPAARFNRGRDQARVRRDHAVHDAGRRSTRPSSRPRLPSIAGRLGGPRPDCRGVVDGPIC